MTTRLNKHTAKNLPDNIGAKTTGPYLFSFPVVVGLMYGDSKLVVVEKPRYNP